MARKSINSVIMEMILERWKKGGWKVHYYLQPDRRDPKMLATVDEDNRIVHIYPHPGNEPPEKTGLHEMLHITFDLGGDKHHEEWAAYLENWLWKRLTKAQKLALKAIFVEPLKT